eukprot:4235554-Amphidinium_carterae.1
MKKVSTRAGKSQPLASAASRAGATAVAWPARVAGQPSTPLRQLSQSVSGMRNMHLKTSRPRLSSGLSSK